MFLYIVFKFFICEQLLQYVFVELVLSSYPDTHLRLCCTIPYIQFWFSSRRAYLKRRVYSIQLFRSGRRTSPKGYRVPRRITAFSRSPARCSSLVVEIELLSSLILNASAAAIAILLLSRVRCAREAQRARE